MNFFQQERLGSRLKQAGVQLLTAALILFALYLFAWRWNAFALLVPGAAIVVLAVYTRRILRILRLRHAERRHQDRRHTDRRDRSNADSVGDAHHTGPGT